MIRDVEYLLHKGTYRLKALTQAAKEDFARLLSMPGELVEGEKVEIFITGVSELNMPGFIEELQRKGLQTEEPPKEPEPPPTHLWTF